MKISIGAAERRVTALPQRFGPLVAPLIVVVATLVCMLAGAQFGRFGIAFHVDDPQAEQALVRFHNLERNEQGPFRWAQPLAAIFLYGFEGRPTILSMRLIAPRPADQPQPTLTVGTAAPAQFTVAPGWRRYTLLVPSDPDGETAVQLRTAPAFVPAEDPHELGVVLSEVQAQPATLPATGLPVRNIYLLTLPLIIWMLAWRLGASPTQALVPALLPALLAGWAKAMPTEADYLLPTLGWPWWPLLPLLLLPAAPSIRSGLRNGRTWLNTHRSLAWGGLGLALLALLAIRSGAPALLGASVALVGVWAGRSALIHEPSTATSARWIQLIVGGSLLLALLLRLINLEGQPAGLWRDESRHALQALQIWSDPTYRPIYVVAGADLPALMFYLMAPILALFGPHAWDARLVSALAGAFTPLALYWAAAPLIGRRPAVFGAALYAWASWSLSMSRWAFPATLDHVLVLTAVGTAWRALGPARHGDQLKPISIGAMALAGLLGGLATYAYHTGRIAPLALAVVAAVRLGRHMPAWRLALPGLITAAVVGLLTMAPLIWYIAADLDGYNRRVGNVSVFDSADLETQTPLGLLLQNIERYGLMWHVQGEGNGRHHLPEVPMLDPISGLLLAIGVVAALRLLRFRTGVLALLLFWLVYFIPGVFSGNAPHAMRSLGTLAPACALAGLGLTIVENSVRSPKFRRGAVAAILGLSLAFNGWLYFGVMRTDPRVYGNFDLSETAAGQIVQAADAAGVPTYLTGALLKTDTLRYLTYGNPPNTLGDDPIAPDGPALVILPPDASDALRAEALAALGPDGAEISAVPYTPDGAFPLLTIYGRGDAARAVVTP